MPNQDLITTFAKTNFRNKQVPFGIKTDDRRRHMYIIGKTGMGKTTLMENMVVQDIRNGHGVAFLDPHGDSVQKILDCIPSHRVNDVIYFNPADLDHPLAFNILESVDARYKHLVASGLMGVFTKIWANLWSARMEYILNNTILALLDSPGNTLLGITRMYVDKKYRKKIVDNVKDPMVRAFWVDEFANYNEKYRTEAIAPIQNKVGQFLSSGIIRNIVGQPKSTIDLREVMDQNKILIMDLSKGKMGEDNSALLGAMLVTKLQLAAMSRTDIPEPERKDFYLYVDEFQNFATDSFATILSEARKYRLNLIVGHQYIGQLVQERNTKVRDAIFGNVGTLVVFRVGAEDAEFLVKEFEPVFTEVDIVNLPKYQILLKLMINGVASDPFSATTLAPNPEFQTGNMDKVLKVSRERYANPVADVEEKISRWMGAEYHQDAAIVIGAEDKQERVALNNEIADVKIANSTIENQIKPLTASQNFVAEIPNKVIVSVPNSTLGFFEQSKQESASQINAKKNLAQQPLSHLHLQKISNDRHHSSFQPHSQRPPLQKHRPVSQPHFEKPILYSDQKNRSLGQHGLGNDQHQKHNDNKAHYQQHKKINPIWDKIASIQAEKIQTLNNKTSEVIGRILSSPMPPAVPLPNNFTTQKQDRKVILPGESFSL